MLFYNAPRLRHKIRSARMIRLSCSERPVGLWKRSSVRWRGGQGRVQGSAVRCGARDTIRAGYGAGYPTRPAVDLPDAAAIFVDER